MSLDSKALASYVLVSPVYLNLNMRFGYHFAMVDVMCTPRSGSNHILFRYKGGGADYENRRRRVEFLGQVLAAHGFEVSITGDLIDAGLKRPPRKTLLEKMEIVGALLGSTRMLDMSFSDDGAITAFTNRFMKGDYGLGRLHTGRDGHNGPEAG
jgi:pyruvate,water dikinase